MRYPSFIGIVPYLTARGSCPGSLFITSKGAYITRQFFRILLSILLVKAGLPQKQFNTHNFRKEAAISAKAAHISDVHIQATGQWQSNANELYIKTPSNRHGILLNVPRTAGSPKIVPKQLTLTICTTHVIMFAPHM